MQKSDMLPFKRDAIELDALYVSFKNRIVGILNASEELCHQVASLEHIEGTDTTNPRVWGLLAGFHGLPASVYGHISSRISQLVAQIHGLKTEMETAYASVRRVHTSIEAHYKCLQQKYPHESLTTAHAAFVAPVTYLRISSKTFAAIQAAHTYIEQGLPVYFQALESEPAASFAGTATSLNIYHDFDPSLETELSDLAAY